MNKTWIISILYYFYEIHTLSYAVTVPVNRPIEIRCNDNTVINITGMTVETSVTECAQSTSCSISNDDKQIVQNKCNDKSSCVLSSDMFNSSCLQEYGYLNFSYSCQELLTHTCDFEKGWCDWIASSTDNDTYIWKRGKGPTPRSNTGPDNDHTLLNRNGSYVYTDARYNGSHDDVTYLRSGLIIPSREQCLTFWYHMFGQYINTLTVYQWNDERDIFRQLWTASDDKGNHWFNQILSLQQDIGPYHIIFKADRGNWNISHIALDDIVITNSKCNGPMNYVRSCVNVEYNIDVQECSKYYMEFNQSKVSFDPEFDVCSDIYTDINNYIGTLCDNGDNSDFCIFNLSYIQERNPECSMLNRFLIEYTCEDISNTRNISSPSQISGNSQDLGVVGGVVGGVIILVIAALALFILFRRSRTVKRGSKSPPHNINMNGHTGVQNKAFSNAVYQTTEKEQSCELQASNNDNYLYDETTGHREDRSVDSEYMYMDIENIPNNSLREAVASNNEVNDQYANLNLPSDRENGTTEYLQGSLHSDGHTLINSDKAPCTSGMGLHNENQYAVLYSDVPHANSTFDAETNPPGNYHILDTKAIGFNRSKEDVPGDYELATPISSADAGDIEESKYPTYSDQDLYVTSEDGIYDTSNNIHYKDTDNSMYSHTIDSVYDTTSHAIMADGNEDTYDHFFGKNNDNDYDVTKRTY